jgi:hypothetical protein
MRSTAFGEAVTAMAAKKGVNDEGVRASREVILRKGHTHYGIISKTTPTWAWFVGSEGKVKWCVGKEDLPIRNSKDSTFHRTGAVAIDKLEEVDVVLCQGFKPGSNHAVWKLPATQAVLWFNHGFRGGELMPKDWTVTKRMLDHDRLGGVTNARCTLFVAQRKGAASVRWKQPPASFSNTLGHR